MATEDKSKVAAQDGVAQIGAAAGQVWRVLSDSGPLSVTKLVQEVDAPKDLVMQALGWLAREDKLAIEEVARRKVISLREPA